MRKSIIWFKTDLRLHDNETLTKAIKHSDEILPVYCFDPAHFQKTEYGFQKTGVFRAQFLLEALQDLDTNLRQLGSGLTILHGKPSEAIVSLAKNYGATTVFAKKEVAFEEKQLEYELEQALWHISCGFETYSTSTLYHATNLPFPINDIPEVFTAFRKAVEVEAIILPKIDKPKALNSPKIEKLLLPTLAELNYKTPLIDARQALTFVGGETAGLERLHYYLFGSKLIKTYKETRNELIGADYSSKFSAWLAMGCLSPRQIYYEIKAFETENGANVSTYWLVFELLWRDYFRFMMKKHRNKFFQENGLKNNKNTNSKYSSVVFDSWKNGETGNDFIDANMIELNKTGFMSNRGRQNVASYLINNLKQDWRHGAAYFEQQLIDYDVSSNWGNWAYLAGVGTDPRGLRIFNIEHQADTYDKNLNYRKLWLSKI